MDYKELFCVAKETVEKAYAPYSNFKVGAALLSIDNKIFTGVNVENSSFGGTICAERVACVKAVSEGYKNFKAIAIATSEGKASMCGICRQFLSEFGTDIDVVTGENEDNLEVKKLNSLLPDSFKLN